MSETYKTLKQLWRYMLHAQSEADYRYRLELVYNCAVSLVNETREKLRTLSKEESNA